ELIDISPQGVAPGDLITAELFNQILSDVNSLKLRVAALEGEAGAPVITRITPSGDLRTGGQMTIIGSNFNAEPRRNIVRIGSEVLTPLRTGSTSSISVQIPLDLPDVPSRFDVSVENEGLVSNSLPVTIIEREFAQFGEFDVGPATVPDGIMRPEQRLEISWDVTADTAQPDELTFSLQVSNAQGASASSWPTPTFSPASPASIEVGQTRTVTMAVTPPAGARAADLALNVTGIEGRATGSSQPPIEWRAGEPLVASSPNATISITNTSTAFIEVDDMDIGGNTFHGIEMQRDALGRIILELVNGNAFGRAGTFAMSAFVESNAGDWDISTPDPSAISSLPSGADVSIDVDVTNTGGTTGEVTFLRVEARQTSTAGDLETFTTFALIPLRLT
ncbi:MAG: IPT/TIG domain-containing protein, partial [Pseudomonadota bacterium]